MSIQIKKQTSYSNTSYYSGRPLKYIVIHYTAGSSSKDGSAKNTAIMFSNPSVYASADFIVDDKNIIQFNPDIRNYYCWHCGDNKAYTKGGSYYGKCLNSNSIGIEICCTNSNWTASDQANSSKWSFTVAAVNNAVELVKYLMDTYNIPVSNVIRHYDVTGKLCPGIKGWNADSGDESQWNDFKKKIGNSTTQAPEVKTNTEVLYRVRRSSTDAKTQKGAYKNLDAAKKLADQYATEGYKVYNNEGKLIYEPKATTNDFKAYTATVTADVLNVRSGPGTNYKINTTIRKGEVYTIVEEKSGWGRLKSGAGWCSLNYMKKR